VSAETGTGAQAAEALAQAGSEAGARRKLAVFGGTFDPPHIGHLIAAQDAHVALGLDRVLFIPAASPPHKRRPDLSPAALRMAMVEAAIGRDDRFEAGDLELRRNGPSYTVDTLRELRASAPESALFLLIGADQYRDLHAWREPDAIATLAKLVVLHRAGESYRVVDRAPAPYRDVAVTRIDVTSTEVRRRVRAGQPIRYLVPRGVEEIIDREGLYR
jgi:nicotinate-nucleotide adenylyltransferase